MTANGGEWSSLYAAVRTQLRVLGTEDPYGNGEFWVVDDDYGDLSLKVCVHRKAFLTHSFLATVQATLASHPNWRVVVQIEFPVEGVEPNSTGFVIHSDRVEEHWDRSLHQDIAVALGL